MQPTSFLGPVILCFWFAFELSAPTDLEAKQDHDLVLRDLILACADYEGLLRLNNHWMKIRPCGTTFLLVSSLKKEVDWDVSAQSIIWDT